MPELPEVESVRVGAQEWFAGRQVRSVEVHRDRAVRHHELGTADFESRLVDAAFGDFSRRGKFMWVPLDSGDLLTFHLGMSGQVRAINAGRDLDPHLRAEINFDDDKEALHFVDQRTFGYLRIDESTTRFGDGQIEVPTSLGHIAPDPFDPDFDLHGVVAKAKRKRSPIKAVLLDQSVASGIGNIYADEALWRAQVRGSVRADRLSKARIRELYLAARDVMAQAIKVGGTSFDALYVNVNGDSGYFDRSLDAYGREGHPCSRCGTPIRRTVIAGRSSHFCQRCQR